MSDGRGGRQAVAELRWDTGADPVVTVGGRSLHHFWPMLSPYFRDVLLPPLRRPEGNAVSWRWLEPVRSREVTAAELRSMRKRLRSEQELLAENLARAEGAGGASGMRQRMDPRELAAAIGGVIDGLAGSDDATLAGFVAQTEAGLRLHSWGAAIPAPVLYPGTPDESPEAAGAAGRGPTQATSSVASTRRHRWWWVILGLGTTAGVGVLWMGSTRDAPPEERLDPAAQETNSLVRGPVESAAGEAGLRSAAGTRGAEHAAKISERRTVARLEPEPELASTAAQEKLPQPGESTYFLNQPPAAKAKPLETEERGKGRPSPARPDRPSGPAAGAKSGAMSDATSVAPAERVDGIENQHRARAEPRTPAGPATDVDVRSRAEPATAADREAPPAVSRVADPLQDDGPQRRRKAKQAEPTLTMAGPTPVTTDPLPRPIDAEMARAMSAADATVVLTLWIPRWRAQLLTDVILPTRPRRWGGPDEAKALHAQAATEARERLPVTLRAPQVRGGIGFEVGAREPGRWWWQQPDGTRRQRVEGNEGHAELSWEDLFHGQTWVLAHETRGPQAEARWEGNRVRVTVRGDVKGYQWSEIQVASAEIGARWNWRRPDGAPLPVGANTRSVDASGWARIETPLGASEAVTTRVAFFDSESGWALIGEPGPGATARR